MKKVLLSIITIIYMVLACGVAMEIHYCMGRQAGVEFYGSINKKCGLCGMTEKKGCCHDEHQFYKLDDSHKSVYNNTDFTAPFTIVENACTLFNWQLPASITCTAVNNNSPPGFTSPPARILHGVFKI